MSESPVSAAVKAALTLAPGPWLVGFSGGADSTALVYALHLLKAPFEAVHCNFNLRGEESMRDEKFCRDFCESLGIPLTVLDFDARKAAAPGVSIEMACRDLRYNAWRQMREERGCTRIAVAHHALDNVETFLINLLRGAGINGLAAMPVDNGSVVRPFLDLTKQDILGFLAWHKINYVSDSSNTSNAFRRNFLRNEVLPLLQTQWPEAAKSISRAVANLSEEAKIVKSALEAALPNPSMLAYDSLERFVSPSSLIHHFAAPLGASARQEEEMLALSQGSRQCGKTWQLPGGSVTSTRHGLMAIIPVVAPVEDVPEISDLYDVEELPAETGFRKALECSLDQVALPCHPSAYELRHPRRTDKISPLGMTGGSTSVMKILKDAGVPAPLRKSAWVLANRSTGKIIWVPGHKRSRHDQVAMKNASIYFLSPKK